MNNTWSHAAARTLVRPLVGTWVKPNHITTLRLLTGVAACLLLARGGGTAELWSGLLWLFSAFLDRADGELARIGKMQSRRGHLYDYYTDVALNSGFFLAAGFNLRYGWLGHWAILAGVAACIAMIACCILSETYENFVGTGERVFEGGWDSSPTTRCTCCRCSFGLIGSRPCCSPRQSSRRWLLSSSWRDTCSRCGVPPSRGRPRAKPAGAGNRRPPVAGT